MRLLNVSLVLISFALLAAAPADARTYASMVVDADTGETLLADGPDKSVYPASLTKIMTLFMVFDAIDAGKISWTTPLKVSKRAAGMPPSKFGLRSGQTIKVRDAVLGLITKSANDVAVVIAEALAGSESAFARQMTEKARRIGMRSTTFRNASGLPDGKQQTTARDMIRLGLAIQREHPRNYRLFSTQRFSYRGKNYRNHNKLLSRYSGTDGIKTGYIRASGFNLLASVERNNRRVVAVVFGGRTGRSRDDHMIGLLDKAFAKTSTLQVARVIPPSPRRPTNASPTITVATAPAPRTEDRNAAIALNSLKQRNDLVGRLLDESDGARPADAPAGAVPLRIVVAPPTVAEAQAQGDSEADSLMAQRSTADGDFGVQVGAFTSHDLATSIVAQIVDRAPQVLAPTAPEVTRVTGTRGVLYRARRVGLTRGDAEEVCKILERHKHPCMVFRAQNAAG